jgi:hypothetical protein
MPDAQLRAVIEAAIGAIGEEEDADPVPAPETEEPEAIEAIPARITPARIVRAFRRLYDEGASYTQIGEQIGASPSLIGQFASRHWPPREQALAYQPGGRKRDRPRPAGRSTLPPLPSLSWEKGRRRVLIDSLDWKGKRPMHRFCTLLLPFALAACGNTVASLRYTPPAPLWTAATPSIGAVSATDQRKEAPMRLATIMGMYGNPLKTLDTAKSVKDEVADAFMAGLRARGLLTSSDQAPFHLDLLVRKFDADMIYIFWAYGNAGDQMTPFP